MTPTEQDKELRESIEDLISQVGNYWFCIAKETSDSRTLSEGEAMKQIMKLITADRKRVELEARLDERQMLSFHRAYGKDYQATLETLEENNDKRIAELKQELESYE